MEVVHLEQLEDSRPLARIGEMDRLLRARGPDAQAAVIAKFGISPEEFKVLALRERQELQEQQGVASYVGELAAQLRVLKPPSVIVEGLAKAALTDLFKDVYSVNVVDLVRSTGSLRVCARTYALPGLEKDLTLQYQTFHDERVVTFWELLANGVYGFVNMHCLPVPMADILPLSGAGNIAFVPGVGEALKADVRMLADVIVERGKNKAKGSEAS